jgi:hypothetical protein
VNCAEAAKARRPQSTKEPLQAGCVKSALKFGREFGFRVTEPVREIGSTQAVSDPAHR